MFTRRTATVIISAPEASCACTISAGDEYLPVPTISLDVKVLSAIVKLSTTPSALNAALSPQALASANEVHDFNGVSLANHGVGVRVPFDNDEVVLDCHSTRIDVE